MKLMKLIVFMLFLFTYAANAAEITVKVSEGQSFAYAIDDGEVMTTERVGPAEVTFVANRNATYTFYGVAGNGVISPLGEQLVVTDEGGAVNETGSYGVAVDTRKEKEIDGLSGAVMVDLAYSSDRWGETNGVSATIAVAYDGGTAKPFATGLIGEGTVTWKPKFDGTYVFTHTVEGMSESATIKLVRFLGTADNPWKVGAGEAEAVKAYVKDGYLYLAGAGEVMEFAEGAPWKEYEQQVTSLTGAVLPRTVKVPASVVAMLPISLAGGTPTPAPEPLVGAVTSWDALTNAVATAESGAEIAVGADIEELDGVLTVKKGQKLTIMLYGKLVTCRAVVVQGELSVGSEDDAVGKIVATEGVNLSWPGTITLLGGPMRRTFTVASQGIVLGEMEVNITAKALEGMFEGEMPTAEELTAERTEGNGLPLLDCYVLGLDKDDEGSKPFINKRKASEPGKLALGLDGVKVNEASGVGVKWTLKESADNVRFEAVEGQSGKEESEFEIELPNEKVRYYKIEYSME